jgi:SAM-dependent methyltransferase
MIEVLDLHDRAMAEQVLRLQRLASRVEADLSGFDGVPPLHESIDELIAHPLEWRGIELDGRLVAAIAFTGTGRRCDIERLIVDPALHRRGLARRLLESVLPHESLTASTAAGNVAALSLYESLGFRRIGRREVAQGVWTVQLARWNDHLKTSFDSDVEGYEAARPGYPPQLFDALEQHAGLRQGSRVLEVGPGTGQATLPLLDRGAAVVAVEAGVHMAALLRRRVAGRACTVIHAEFEHADLQQSTAPDRFDLAVAATSFHWVDTAVGIARLAALLEPGKAIALWWTVFGDVGPNGHRFVELLQPIAKRFQTNERVAAQPYALDTPTRIAEIEAGGAFAVERVDDFEWPWVHDGASLRALFASFSDWSTLPEPDCTRALDDVSTIVDQHFDGRLERRYVTRLYVARRVPTR